MNSSFTIAQQPEEVGRLVAVDVDETLIVVNSFPLLVRMLPVALLRSGHPVKVFSLGGALVRRKVLRGSHASLKSVVCRLTADVPEGQLRRWASRVLAQHGDPIVVQMVTNWDGPRLLTSAAPQIAVEHFAALIGFSSAHGSRSGADGFVENVGSEKTRRMNEEAVTRPALAISDDPVLDRPLLSLADRALVVSGDRSFTAFQ